MKIIIPCIPYIPPNCVLLPVLPLGAALSKSSNVTTSESLFVSSSELACNTHMQHELLYI